MVSRARIAKLVVHSDGLFLLVPSIGVLCRIGIESVEVELLIIVLIARRVRRAHLNMVLWLTDLWKVIVLSKRSVLSNQLQRTHKVVIALDHLHDLLGALLSPG